MTDRSPDAQGALARPVPEGLSRYPPHITKIDLTVLLWTQSCIGRRGMVLEGAGLSELEELVYRSMVGRATATAAQIAQLTGLGPTRVGRILADLEAKGFVGRVSGKKSSFVAAPPDLAIEALIRRREEEHGKARLAAQTLLADYRRAQETGDAELVELVRGREAVHLRSQQMQRSARQEVLLLEKPPYAAPPESQYPRAEDDQLERGVRYRVIYERSSLEIPDKLEWIRRGVSRGEEARVLSDLPLKLLAVDRRAAVALSPKGETVETAVVILDSEFVAALALLFESLWERAIPVPMGDDDTQQERKPGDEPLDQDLLTFLASGMKDEAIAKQLGLSARSVRRRVAQLMKKLSAESRFQAGVQAARKGWL